MYEKFQDTYNFDNNSYILKKKFPSGVTVELEFFLGECDPYGPMYVQIGLRSYTKRKQRDQPDFEFSVRGKDGLEPAVWATEALLEFPEYIFNESYFRHKTSLVYEIFWSNARRRDIYHKWLSRYGFYFSSSEGNKCLMKVFEKDEG